MMMDHEPGQVRFFAEFSTFTQPRAFPIDRGNIAERGNNQPLPDNRGPAIGNQGVN